VALLPRHGPAGHGPACHATARHGLARHVKESPERGRRFFLRVPGDITDGDAVTELAETETP
jgi:hypothetical protein